jgi:hypothetical protein
MVNIKRFVDRVSAMDSRSNRDLVLPAAEARALRDEIVKFLLDNHEEKLNKQPEVIGVQISGGRW